MNKLLSIIAFLLAYTLLAACEKHSVAPALAPTGYNYTSKMGGSRDWKGNETDMYTNLFSGLETIDSQKLNRSFPVEIVNDTFIIINGDKLRFASFDTSNKKIDYTYDIQTSTIITDISVSYYYKSDSVVYYKYWHQIIDSSQQKETVISLMAP